MDLILVFQFLFHVRIGHFLFSSNALAIIFNNDAWQSSFSNVLVLLTRSSEKEFTIWKTVF